MKRTTGGKKRNRGPSLLVSWRKHATSLLKVVDSNATVLVLINPDPDSLASAMAVKRLLWKQVRRTVIASIGEIKRLDNLAMIELLKIPLVALETVDPEDFSHFILVDSQPDHSPALQPFRYDAIIDHHPKQKKWNVPYVDIRPKYGANSTMMTEYLRGAGIKPSMNLATALLYAIKTDTSNFERSGIEEDVNQFRFLFKHANMNLLQKIERSEFKVGDLEYFRKALENRIVTKKGLYSHIGDVPSADICVQVADFFTRAHGLGWVFVSGVYKEYVIIIARNDGYRKNAGKLMRRAFGSLGSAGGHRGAARAEIPLIELKAQKVRVKGPGLRAFIRKRLGF